MFLDMLKKQAVARPHEIALRGESGAWSWLAYSDAVKALADSVAALGVRRLALEMDNGPEWAIIDLACLAGGVTLVPVPPFFSAQQKAWVRESASVDACIGAERLPGWRVSDFPYGLLQRRAVEAPAPLPAGTAKITYTSGTTGAPKGVCLSRAGMAWTAKALADALGGLGLKRHLVMLPLSILLENLCGTYVPLLLGAETVILPPARVGFEGSSRFNPARLADALTAFAPQSLVLVPELLRVLLPLHRQAADSTRALRFVAVGGGKVPAPLLNAALAEGLPVYEGYGLSECGSVVALNLPGAAKAGSVGQPLPGVRVSVDDRRQLCVSSPANALGYLGADPAPGPVETGDLGTVDDQGFIHLQGRLKNVQITAFGRNFSPEWPESEAMACPAVRRAVVFGDGLRRNVALIDAVDGQQAEARLQLQALSARLPDYAQLHRLLFTSAISTPEMLTANGRPRRDIIRQTLWQQILTCSEEESP